MSDISVDNSSAVEEYDFGLIDEYGKLRVLVGKHFLSLNCLDIFKSGKSSDYSCKYACSHFSGPNNIVVVKDGKECTVVVVKLLCSGRTFVFKRFLNLLKADLLKTHESEETLDFSNMSDEEIIEVLGLREQTIEE